MFIEYVGLYALLLMTMTHSATMHVSDAAAYPVQLQVWVYLGVSLGIMVLLALHNFRGRLIHLGVVLTVASVVLFNQYMERLMAAINWSTFVLTNNLLLGVLALIFHAFEVYEYSSMISQEAQETMAHGSSIFHKAFFRIAMCPVLISIDFFMTPFGTHVNKEYYQSEFNRFQGPTYIAVLVYVVAQLTNVFSDTLNLYVSVLLTLILWVLGLQLLEVHPTVGYVVPMMRDVVMDVLRFFAFVAPFLCAYTFAYYILFQSVGAKVPPGYTSIPRSFRTTYLNMLGQVDLTPFNELPAPYEYLLGHALLLSQGTVVVIMLINVLIAMMAKTVGDGLKKAKTAQQMAFASCVLRSEKIRGLDLLEKNDGETERCPMMHQHPSWLMSRRQRSDCKLWRTTCTGSAAT
ncbi:hypothetical protein ACHHYP_08512 [Achlya hypogyna]|uniref:Ion transport domain-containing protein n=1 Tax=Achlya hypogyna TaxID=1202772 RepID=A0A1V9YPE8_ACHHY|nr:hypothetical protein ACHHYP_08512 [Achlya hypogyna]